jgi:hypothetical protein
MVWWCFLMGIILFSGSLYLLAVTNILWLGAITPLGGLSFLLGWALLYSIPKRSLRPDRLILVFGYEDKHSRYVDAMPSALAVLFGGDPG